MNVFLTTSIALLAFAGNSVLCRLALGDNTIDAASFTAIRLLSGVVILAIIAVLGVSKKPTRSRGSWKGAFMLFLYAITFSFAYNSLDTGTGALILFGAVQITMIVAGLYGGDKLHGLEWLGLLIAFIGLVYLVLPGVGAPSFSGFLLMAVAGVAWGGYSLVGKGSEDPLQDTTYNFYRTLPFVIVLVAATVMQAQLTAYGVFLAVLSGGIASGLGYAVWYMALKGITGTQAAVVQLLVPILAALGGVLLVNEAFSLRLMFAALLTLGGVCIVVFAKRYANRVA